MRSRKRQFRTGRAVDASCVSACTDAHREFFPRCAFLFFRVSGRQRIFSVTVKKATPGLKKNSSAPEYRRRTDGFRRLSTADRGQKSFPPVLQGSETREKKANRIPYARDERFPGGQSLFLRPEPFSVKRKPLSFFKTSPQPRNIAVSCLLKRGYGTSFSANMVIFVPYVQCGRTPLPHSAARFMS